MVGAVGIPLARRRIPEKIKCTKCKKNKSQNFYSNRQLDMLYTYINRNGNGPAPALRCKVCNDGVTGQTNEMKCQSCLKWKPKSEFANSMRKIPDDAWCKQCKQIQGQIDPIAEEFHNNLPPVTSLRRGKFSSASDAFDDDDLETVTNPFSSLAGSVDSLSLKSGESDTKAPILLNMFNRPLYTQSKIEGDEDNEDLAFSDTVTEKSTLTKSKTKSFKILDGKISSYGAGRSNFEEEDDEDGPVFSTRRALPKSRIVPDNSLSIISDDVDSLPRDRTVPIDPDSSVWQSLSMTKPRVAPGGKLPSSMIKTFGGVGVAIGHDGLPEGFDRTSYGDPTAGASNSAVESSLGCNRYTESRYTEASNRVKKFGKPAPVNKPAQVKFFNMDEPVKRVIPAPESDSESDFCD